MSQQPESIEKITLSDQLNFKGQNAPQQNYLGSGLNLQQLYNTNIPNN